MKTENKSETRKGSNRMRPILALARATACSFVSTSFFSTPSAIAVRPTEFFGKTISPSFTFTRIAFSSSTTCIQHPIISHTSVTFPFTCTVFPTYCSGEARIVTTGIGLSNVNPFPNFSAAIA